MAKATTKRAREQARAEAATPRKAKNTGATPPAKVGRGSGRGSSTKVMGLTIPKGLTKVLDSLVNSQRGRELLASALVAAAGAAAAALVKSSDKTDERDHEGRPVDIDRPPESGTNGLALAAAGALAEMATRAFTGGKPNRRG
jgi:hypothetical protein